VMHGNITGDTMIGLSGSEAEDRACLLLKELGYRIVARNWRCRFGEIDIIARDGRTVAFVEVKARSSGSHGGPDGAVDGAKQRRIAATAALFLQETRCELPSRFDVVTFSGSSPRVYRDAFRVG
jgi:putative endonuclease